MNLQPLYDVKERLEYAAIAGTGLLAEDFRLKRAAEGLKPLAAASPVFGKIDVGLDKLFAAPPEARAGLLLDTLALVDAVVYTQAKAGIEGDMEPLPAGCGVYQKISYGQIAPLLTALTTTGSGRLEVIQSAWESHPEWFADFRVLPVVAADLADSYGEIAELNTKILKQTGPAALPVLKQGFDPAGKKEMARRVEVIAAIEGAASTSWLREILPEAKKDVRIAVLTALGGDGENAALLLELAQTERGSSREAVLTALAMQNGDAVRAFWESELAKNSQSVKLLRPSNTDWAIDLVTSGLRERLERFLTGEKRPTQNEANDLAQWCFALGQKDSPAMVEFWRWADEHMEAIDGLANEKGNPLFLGVRLTDGLRETIQAGSGPLREFCMTLWEQHPTMTRYLFASFHAALLSCPAIEVYARFAPYLLTEEPAEDAELKKSRNTVLLRALGEVSWDRGMGCYVLAGGRPIAQPLDIRWIERLTQAVWKEAPRTTGGGSPFVYWENVDEFDQILMRLAVPYFRQTRELLIPYLRGRMAEKGNPHTYSRWLFQLGGSPKGVLGQAMAKNPDGGRLRAVWDLMNEAAKALPAGEVADLLEEVFDAKGFYKLAWADANRIVPKTAALLRAGEPFPTWEEWTKM